MVFLDDGIEIAQEARPPNVGRGNFESVVAGNPVDGPNIDIRYAGYMYGPVPDIGYPLHRCGEIRFGRFKLPQRVELHPNSRLRHDQDPFICPRIARILTNHS